MVPYNDFMAIVLYTLLSVLIVVLIIFVIRLIKTLNKVDKVVDDVSIKVDKLNGVFNIIDTTTETLAEVSDKFTNFIASKINHLFKKKEREEKEDE